MDGALRGDNWESYIPLEQLQDGKPLHLSGGDVRLPGPDGWEWVISAAMGSLRLVPVPPEQEESLTNSGE